MHYRYQFIDLKNSEGLVTDIENVKGYRPMKMRKFKTVVKIIFIYFKLQLTESIKM
jgi:hypothetical protein